MYLRFGSCVCFSAIDRLGICKVPPIVRGRARSHPGATGNGAKERAMTKGQHVLAISCGIEAATGLGLLVAPAVVAKLLIGADIEGSAIIIGNIAGVALISLAIACWPRGEAIGSRPYFAMLVYNVLAALLLAETGATATATGVLLWPVVVIHLIFAVLIALASIGSRRGTAHQV
jgi:hypothetical protein